jgi:iron complex transport system ATP-binding protein
MLRFKDISYKYKGENSYALKDFCLRAEAGRVTALLGPNGSGKSTALGIAAGWLMPAAGILEREGRVAFLPQMERLAFAFSCVEYVSFGRAPHLPYLGIPGGKDAELARQALARVGMVAKADKRVSALSGGELQLVRLARALVQEARWTVLDEPSDMLDPAHILALVGVLRAITAAGGGVLLSTHDLGFALATADDAALIKDGRLIVQGTRGDVLTPQALGELYGLPFAWDRVPGPLHTT